MSQQTLPTRSSGQPIQWQTLPFPLISLAPARRVASFGHQTFLQSLEVAQTFLFAPSPTIGWKPTVLWPGKQRARTALQDVSATGRRRFGCQGRKLHERRAPADGPRGSGRQRGRRWHPRGPIGRNRRVVMCRHRFPRVTEASSYTLSRKYSIVRLKPLSKSTCGSQCSSFLAKLMSGRRCFGSSTGNGL